MLPAKRPAHAARMILLVLAAVAGLIIYWDSLTFKNWLLNRDVGWDPITQWWPYWRHIAQYSRSEGLPMWSFSFGLGQNIFPGNLNNPFFVILYLIGDNLLYALGYVQLLKVLLAAMLFLFYARAVGLSEKAQMIGALCFAFCGHMVLRGNWFTFPTDLIIAAFMLLAFEQWFSRRTWVLLPLAVSAFGIGHAFYFYFFTIILWAYAGLRFTAQPRERQKGWKAFGSRLAALYGLGVLLAAVYVIPEVADLANHPRVAGNYGFFRTVAGAGLHFADPLLFISEVFRLFSNDLLGIGDKYTGAYNYFDSPTLYCGLLPLLILPQAVRLSSRRTKAALCVPIAFCAFYLAFPIFRFLLNGLMTSSFYDSDMIVPLVVVCVSAKAIHQIEKEGVNPPLLVVTVLALLFVLGLGYLVLNRFHWTTARLDPALAVVCGVLTLLYSLLLLGLGFRGARRFSSIMLIMLAAAEMCAFGAITIRTRPMLLPIDGESYLRSTKTALDYLARQDHGFFRIEEHDYDCVSFNDAQLFGFNGTKSYYSFNGDSYLEFNRALEVPFYNPGPNETKTIQGFGSRYLLDTFVAVKYFLLKDARKAPPHTTRLASFGDVSVFKNDLFIPIGFGASSVLPYDEFAKLPPAKKDEILLRAAVAAEGVAGPYGLSGLDTSQPVDLSAAIARIRRNALEISEHRQNHLKGVIDLERDSMLVLTIPYDKGWSLRVDGRPEALLRVDIGFMGAPVAGGRHSVELDYVSPGLRAGAAISGVAILAYLFLLATKAGLA